MAAQTPGGERRPVKVRFAWWIGRRFTAHPVLSLVLFSGATWVPVALVLLVVSVISGDFSFTWIALAALPPTLLIALVIALRVQRMPREERIARMVERRQRRT